MVALSGRSFLIVEDDDDLRESIRDIVEGLGAQVYATASGKKAVDLIDSCRLDALIVDMMLPEIRGIDLIPRASAKGVSIVAISGDPQLEANTIYHRGAHVFLRKPFNLLDVIDATTRHLPPKPQQQSLHEKLSQRELEVLGLIKNGYESAQISALLGISKNTVAFHRKSIRRKHQQRSFIEICSLYFR